MPSNQRHWNKWRHTTSTTKSILNQSLLHNPNCKQPPPPLSQNKSAFEKAQESAQKGGVASGLSGMDASALGDMDLDALMASLSPDEVAQMEQLMKDMGDVDMGAAMDQMQGEGLLIVMYCIRSSRPKPTYKPRAKKSQPPPQPPCKSSRRCPPKNSPTAWPR